MTEEVCIAKDVIRRHQGLVVEEEHVAGQLGSFFDEFASDGPPGLFLLLLELFL